MNYYIKQSPITGLAGFGGGASGLNVAGSAIPIWYGDRAFKWGGNAMSGTYRNSNEYKAISTDGDAADFGDMVGQIVSSAGCCDGNKGIMQTGYVLNSNVHNADIQWFTVSTLGDATQRGDLTENKFAQSACSDGTLGFCVGGGKGRSGWTNTGMIEVFTMATSSNASDAGDLTSSTYTDTSITVNDATRAVRCGGASGNGGTRTDMMDYFTMATSVTSTDFGDLKWPSQALEGCGNDTRGVVTLGSTLQSGSTVYEDQIQYITIQSPGNATDFGDLTQVRNHASSATNGTRAIFMTGYSWPGNNMWDIIDKIEIDTTGNATDLADVLDAVWESGSCSGNA
tara:strand:+ start:2815 stop:3837 length:1023 start_codon:yes stop_codon:yes gene_type:complete